MKSINDINFIEHGGRYGKQLGLFTLGHYWVGRSEMVLAWEIFHSHLSCIDWSKKVCSETFFTTEIWHQFPKLTLFQFGRCFKYFCVHEMLPIEVANPGKKGKLFFKQKEK